MISTWVYLVRHGEVEDAALGRFFGHTDVALSATGRRQVEALARRLARFPVGTVCASDLLRAQASAAPLAAARGVTTETVPALREMAMGRWEGLTFREIREREPDVAASWLADPVAVAFPGGESLLDLRARAVPAFDALRRRHAGGHLAVVAHGGVNRVLLAEALGLPLANVLRLAQDYACWNVLEYRGETVVLHALNQRLEP